MVRYALLIAPSANRVYAEAAYRLTRAELALFADGALDARPGSVGEEELGGVRYVVFDVPEPGLSERDIAYVSNLSAGYALFERTGEDLLRPVRLRPLARWDDDLVTIPKYAGKTNEQFTALVLNATVLASASAPRMLDGGLTVLDPLCGRGTTLNQALRYGYDAIGIELDGKDVEAYSAFLRTYLRRKRVKHTSSLTPVRQHRTLVARRFTAELGGQHVTVFHGDTTDARTFLRAACADVIVADAPYGVAHGSRAGRALSRSPLDLLHQALPVWVELLRPGGALGLAWNTHVAARADVEAIVAEHGLAVVPTDLAHRVDQAIMRDVVVARKAA